MTTGATGQLGLALPVQGELSGTWGDTVNNGITQYTNIAIAGTLTLTNDGAVTLANTTGDASASNITSTLTGAGTVTAQFAIVRVTGTLTVAKVVTGPSYSKTYTVVNAATGGIVTFKASGQTGVSVAVGETAFVYFNGTDYVKVVGTATAGAAGGSNTQVQFNSSGVLAGSSSLTWDGTTLSSTQVNITGQGTLRLQDTTGGEYVGLRSPSALGASYTLTFPADDGTSGQALITDGSGVLSWSTAASGDVYGPASSTDNAVARFDSTTGKLLQNSVVIVDDTGAVTGVTDLTASGSVTLSGGTANGVTYLNGSKVLTSGSALTFNGSTLGVSAAGAQLSVTNSSGGTVASFTNSTSADLAISLTSGVSLITPSTGILALGVANTETVRLTSSSLYTASGINVGIGTSSPVAKLNVNGNALFNGTTKITGEAVEIQGDVALGDYSAYATSNYRDIIYSASTASFGNQPTAYIRFQTTSDIGSAILFATRSSAGDYAERLRLDQVGNLGLGVTPIGWTGGVLCLSNGSSVSFQGQYGNITANAYYNSGWKYTTTGAASYYDQGAGVHSWSIAASGTAGNPISFTQALTLDADGRLLLGSTTANSSHRMKVTSSTDAGIVLTGANNVGNDASITVEVANGTILMVSDNNVGDGALFFCGYASSTITLLSDPNNRYATSITAGRICVTKSTNSSTVTITNKIGSTRNITAGKLSTSD